MEHIFDRLIDELDTSVFVLLALLAFAIWAAFKLGGWKQIFTQHASRIDKIEDIGSKVIELKTKVDLIYQYTNPNTPVRAASPINLTPVGEQIIKKSMLRIFLRVTALS